MYFQRIEPFTEEELVEKIRESWNEIEIELIQNSISSWKKRLRDVIKSGGHSTEHLGMLWQVRNVLDMQIRSYDII